MALHFLVPIINGIISMIDNRMSNMRRLHGSFYYFKLHVPKKTNVFFHKKIIQTKYFMLDSLNIRQYVLLVLLLLNIQ